MTVIDTSIGNYDLQMYNAVNRADQRLMGQWITISAVLIFNILLMNLIIAVLTNTYSIFDGRSNGLYLAKILASRDELIYDRYFGAFLCPIPIINLIQIPVLPIAIVLPYGNPLLEMINENLMRAQYILFMLIMFGFFIVYSAVLIPLAWIVGMIDKIKTLGTLKS